MGKIFKYLLQITLCSLFIFSVSFAGTIVVKPGENLISSINSSSPGDTVMVENGGYRGGTISQNNVYVLAMDSVFLSSEIYLNADEVVLDGLRWQDIDGNIINVRGSANTIKNCFFKRFGKNSPSKAIWLKEDGNYPDNIVENCLFEDWGSSSFHSSCVKIGQTNCSPVYTGTIIRGNTVRNGASGGNSPAIQPFYPSLIENNIIDNCEDGIETKGSNMIIRSNIVMNCDGDEAMSNRVGSNNLFEANILFNISSYVWQIWTGENNVFRNNIIYNSERIAMIKGGYNPGENAKNVLLINNTFVNVGRGICWDLKKYPPENIQFVNNIFVGDGSTEIESSGRNYISVFKNNHFYKFSPYGESYSTGDPLFVDPDNHDYHLTEGSPAIDSGDSGYPNLPAVDKDGTERPLDGDNDKTACYDKGAYEYSTVNTVINENTNRTRPSDFGLSQNYPNPFNPDTRIEYAIPAQKWVKIQIFNQNGQLVNTLIDNSIPAGTHNVVWNARNMRGCDVSSGIYVYKMTTDNGFVDIKKMILLR